MHWACVPRHPGRRCRTVCRWYVLSAIDCNKTRLLQRCCIPPSVCLSTPKLHQYKINSHTSRDSCNELSIPLSTATLVTARASATFIYAVRVGRRVAVVALVIYVSLASPFFLQSSRRCSTCDRIDPSKQAAALLTSPAAHIHLTQASQSGTGSLLPAGGRRGKEASSLRPVASIGTRSVRTGTDGRGGHAHARAVDRSIDRSKAVPTGH